MENENYDEMTVKELEGLIHATDAEMDKLREKKRIIMGVIAGREAEQKIADLAKGLPDSEKQRLAQKLAPGGVVTKTAIGGVKRTIK